MLHVGVDSWIIEGGNYDDFQCGNRYRFALEFYPHLITIASDSGEEPDGYLPHFERKRLSRV